MSFRRYVFDFPSFLNNKRYSLNPYQIWNGDEKSVKRDRLLEICESSKTDAPESLMSVISSLEDSTDRVQLFLGVVYVLTLESGFEPSLTHDEDIEKTDSCEQSLNTAQQLAKLSVKQQMAFKYNSKKVLRWSKEGLPNSSSSGNLQKWKFRTGGLGPMILSIEFLLLSNTALAIVSGVVIGSSFIVSRCFDLKKFVPRPSAASIPGKFDDLSTVSQELKSALWVAKIEVLSIHGILHKSAFEFLPQHVLELIAKFLPDRNSDNSPQFTPRILIPSRRR